MARYRKVDPRIWNDEKFREFSFEGQLVFIFLMTHPHMTSVGAMRATEPGLAAELGMTTEAFAKAFREPFRKGLVEYDPKACFLCLPNFIKYNQPENPNVLKAWAGAFDLLPECRLKTVLLYRVKAFAEGLPEAFAKAFTEAFAEAFRKGMPNPEPEPEPEQKPEQEPPSLRSGEEPSLRSGSELFPEPGVSAGKPEKRNLAELERRFALFWARYPRHEAKQPARKAFVRLNPDDAELDLMFRWLAMAVQSEQWQDPSRIPHPATWLNQRRWEGDPPPKPGGPGGGGFNARRPTAEDRSQRNREAAEALLKRREAAERGAT